MKKTILITLMVMLTLTIGAQNAAQARKVLDKTAAVVSNKNGATAQFTLSSAKTGTVSGRLSLKGNKFQVTTPHSIIWYNGKTQWSYLKSTEEVNVSTPTAAQQLQMNPYRFINMYKTGYNLGLTDKGKAYWVHLTARNPKNGVPEIYILTLVFLPKLGHILQRLTLGLRNELPYKDGSEDTDNTIQTIGWRIARR